jgi:hypothetical protein
MIDTPQTANLSLVERMLSDDWRVNPLRFADSYSRLPMIMEARPRRSASRLWPLWFRLLGENWSGCDNISEFHLQLSIAFFEHAGQRVELMSHEERAALDALPEKVTIFRGCGPINRLGLSWSLSRAVASRFPFLTRYRQGTPLLLIADVPKSRLVAFKSDRDESEIIAIVCPEHVREEVVLKPAMTGAGKSFQT